MDKDDAHDQEIRVLTAQAAKRLANWVRETSPGPQVSMDIGILIGRLSHHEGKNWLSEALKGKY